MKQRREYRRTTSRDPIVEHPDELIEGTTQVRGDTVSDRTDEVLDDVLDDDLLDEETRTMPLREEELVAEKEMRQVGEVLVRKEVVEVPGRLEVDASREEVEVLHVPIGQAVEQRKAPWQDGDTFIMPIYEEQLVLVKRLVLKEEVRIRRLHTTEKRVYEDTLRRERPVIEDTTGRDAVRERYPTDESEGSVVASTDLEPEHEHRPGPLDRLARKLLE